MMSKTPLGFSRFAATAALIVVMLSAGMALADGDKQRAAAAKSGSPVLPEEMEVLSDIAVKLLSGNVAKMLKDICGVSTEHLDMCGQDLPWMRISNLHFS